MNHAAQLSLLVMLALAAQSCTKKPGSVSLASFRVDYAAYNCGELKQEADLLQDALAVAAENGRSSETISHLNNEADAVRKAAEKKKCAA